MSDPENQAMLNLMREQGLLDNQGMLDNIDIKDDPVHLEPFFTVEESKLFKMNPDVMLLHIELDDEIPEEDRALCGIKYGKTISRDILVQQNLPLHNLHYVINQAFGFTNSHMHEFELSSEDLKWVTAGKVECINRREFAICTDFFRHFAGDFLPPCRDSLPPRQFS